MLLDLSTAGVRVAHALPLTTEGVLPKLRPRVAHRPEDLAADALALATNIRAVLDRATAVLSAGTATSRDLRQLESDLQGNLDALAAFRADLDGWRAVDAIPVVDGAVLLRPAKSVHTFRMRFPIDVAFVDRDLRVIRMLTMAPNRITLPVWRAKAVVEAEAGAFATWGLQLQDQLEVKGGDEPQRRQRIERRPAVQCRPGPRRRGW